LSLITIGSNMGITKMTKEHIFLCLSLKIPFAILITKVDICKDRQNILKETIDSVSELVKNNPIRKIPFFISSKDDVIDAVKNFHTSCIVPIIQTSNVTGQGLDLLRYFLYLTPTVGQKVPIGNNHVEFHIETSWLITGVGTVVGGQLVSGTISVGDKLLLGPENGQFSLVKIKSIQCKRVPVETVKSGCYVTVGLQKVERTRIRRGLVLISENSPKITVTQFEAEVSVLKSHSTTIKVGYEPVLHTCSVRQTAKIVDIFEKKNARERSEPLNISNTNDKILRTGDRAKVIFKFLRCPEYIKPGYRILLSEGKVKIIGIVRKIEGFRAYSSNAYKS